MGRKKYMWAEGCSGREKGLWGLGKGANWKWRPCTPGSKEGIKSIRGRSGMRTGGKATDPIAPLWSLTNLKIPLPSSWNVLSFLSHWCCPKYHWSFPHSLTFQPLEPPSLLFSTVTETHFSYPKRAGSRKILWGWKPLSCKGYDLMPWNLPPRQPHTSLTGAELCLLSHLCELQIASPSSVLPPAPAERPLYCGENMSASYGDTFLPFVAFPNLQFFLVPVLLYVSAPFALYAFPSFWQYSGFVLSPVLSLSLCQSLGHSTT